MPLRTIAIISISKTFSSCQIETLCPLRIISHSSSLPALDNLYSTFSLYEFVYSRYLILVESYICPFVPRCSMYQNFIPFNGWVIFHCRYIPHCIYSFICWWTFRFFGFLTISNNAAMRSGVQVHKPLLAILLGIYLRVELVGHKIILYLTTWGSTKLFSTEPTCSHQQCITVLVGSIFMCYPILFLNTQTNKQQQQQKNMQRLIFT